MATANFVKKARKDYPDAGIKKGESYWWWKFNFSNHRHMSKTKPSRSQLTNSPFYSELFDLVDGFSLDVDGMVDGRNGETTPEVPSVEGIQSEIETQVEEIRSQLEELQSQQQESLDNMPDHLQESSDSGIMLQERIDALESAMGDLDSVQLDVEEFDDWKENNGVDEDNYDEKVEEYKEHLRQEISNVESEIQDALSQAEC